jgi:Na+-translocating ferredoxin:NAD+ oxidoreductase RnfC subunit
MSLIELVRNAGVVGAGGGGFPTHVKLSGKADTVIANGAECEPLLHKDAAVMERESAEVVAGVLAAMGDVGAERGIVGIKKKNSRAVDAISAACTGTAVSVHLLGDYYPAGDEYDLVHETTGRLIPPAGIPLNVGAVVCNVETFANISRAEAGAPVTQKTITLAGAVRNPVTLTVPVGTPYSDILDAAGGLTTDDPILCLGGLMMGLTTDNLDTPIIKTSTGAIVLPRAHHVVARKLKAAETQARIG